MIGTEAFFEELRTHIGDFMDGLDFTQSLTATDLDNLLAGESGAYVQNVLDGFSVETVLAEWDGETDPDAGLDNFETLGEALRAAVKAQLLHEWELEHEAQTVNEWLDDAAWWVLNGYQRAQWLRWGWSEKLACLNERKRG